MSIFQKASIEAKRGNRFPLVSFASMVKHNEISFDEAATAQKIIEEDFYNSSDLLKFDFIYILSLLNSGAEKLLALSFLREVDERFANYFSYLSQLMFSIHEIYPFERGLSALPSDESLRKAKILARGPVWDVLDFCDADRVCKFADKSLQIDFYTDVEILESESNSFFWRKFERTIDLNFSEDNHLEDFLNSTVREGSNSISDKNLMFLHKNVLENYPDYSLEKKTRIHFVLGKIAPKIACHLAFNNINEAYDNAHQASEHLRALVKINQKFGEEFQAPMVDIRDYQTAAYKILNSVP